MSTMAWARNVAGMALLAGSICGCSIKKMAINSMGDALAEGGSTYASDDDPELIKAAVPFSLKLMESLLAEVPEHKGLLFAASSGFTQYAYAFVQQDADEMEDKDVHAAAELRARAKRLYLRARDYGLRALEVAHPGFRQKIAADPKAAVAVCKPEDVRTLYWTAASWGASISVAKEDYDLVGDQPKVEALIDRALELDESYDHGALHSFLVSYELARQGAKGDPTERARKHFERALELSGGRHAGPLVAFAEGSSVKNQDHKEFRRLLEQALAIQPDEKQEWRLVNLVMQRRARWLLSRIDELFLIPESE